MKTTIKGFWLGHSAFRFETAKGTVIFVDPFLSQNPKTPVNEKHPQKADYILLTHGHEDHVGDTLEIAKKTGCKVLSIVELSGLLKKHGLNPDQTVEFNKGGTVNFDEFSVTMTHAHHSSSFAGEYAGDPAGLIISFSDLVVYHLGDTNLMSDFSLYGKLYKPDLALIPIGDHYTMGHEHGAIAAEMIAPKMAVPTHFGTFPVLTGNPETFKSLVETRTKQQTIVKLPNPGEEFLG